MARKSIYIPDEELQWLKGLPKDWSLSSFIAKAIRNYVSSGAHTRKYDFQLSFPQIKLLREACLEYQKRPGLHDLFPSLCSEINHIYDQSQEIEAILEKRRVQLPSPEPATGYQHKPRGRRPIQNG